MLRRRLVTELGRSRPQQVRWLAISRPTQDEDALIFPRERPGLDYALNWSLNGDGVTPYGDAYRLTKKTMAEAMMKDVEAPPPTDPATVAEVCDDEDLYNELFDQSVDILEAAGTLYVAEGDAKGTRIPCRVITDSVAVAGTAINDEILERMPLREPRELPVTAYVTPTGPDVNVLFFPNDNEAKIILSGAHATTNELKASINQAATDVVFTGLPDIPEGQGAYY